MTKILIKKQLMEVFSWIYQDKKTGKNRDKKGLLLYVFFYVFLFGFLAVIFYNMAASLCGPLVEDGFVLECSEQIPNIFATNFIFVCIPVCCPYFNTKV